MYKFHDTSVDRRFLFAHAPFAFRLGLPGKIGSTRCLSEIRLRYGFVGECRPQLTRRQRQRIRRAGRPWLIRAWALTMLVVAFCAVQLLVVLAVASAAANGELLAAGIGIGILVWISVIVFFFAQRARRAWHSFHFTRWVEAEYMQAAVLAIEHQELMRKGEDSRAETSELLRRIRELELALTSVVDVDLMPGREFEDYVAARLRKTGWNVSMTPATGDFGVDVIAEKNGERVAVQCKRLGKTVGVGAIQQVVAGAMHHRCSRSVVVSNREFTKAARLLAHTHDCQLVGRAELQSWTLK